MERLYVFVFLKNGEVVYCLHNYIDSEEGFDKYLESDVLRMKKNCEADKVVVHNYMESKDKFSKCIGEY